MAVVWSKAPNIAEAIHVRDRRLRLGLARSTSWARDRRPRLPFHPRPSSLDLFLRCALHTLPTRLPSTLFDLDALARVRQARAEIDLLVTAEEFCLGVRNSYKLYDYQPKRVPPAHCPSAISVVAPRNSPQLAPCSCSPTQGVRAEFSKGLTVAFVSKFPLMVLRTVL